jgi:hypothetical protein
LRLKQTKKEWKMEFYKKMDSQLTFRSGLVRLGGLIFILIKTMGILAGLLSIGTPVLGDTLNGFYLPEFVQGQPAPYPPVSATAILNFAQSVQGEITLKEWGKYKVKGSCAEKQVTFTLESADSKTVGYAEGTLEESALNLRVRFENADQSVQSRGKIQLAMEAEWHVSGLIKAGKEMQDKEKRRWFEPDFDDRSWNVIHLPDDNSFGEAVNRSRYYRNHFNVRQSAEKVTVNLGQPAEPSSSQSVSQESEYYSLVFSSDDGIWLYINGKFLGHWGAKERHGGCVNDPLNRCGYNGTVPPKNIPEDWLVPGDNLIAVKVHNGACCYSYFNLLCTRVKTRLLSEAVDLDLARP